MWSAVRYFLVAAFLTPQTPLARYIGSPERSHSLRSHSFIGNRRPSGVGNDTSRT